jgi:transcriptional regulator with XRE-family HTH domain
MKDMPPEELERIFRRNLRFLRERLQLTQTALARRSGIRQSVLSNLELGENSPTLRTVAKLSIALGVGPTALISSDLVPEENSALAIP